MARPSYYPNISSPHRCLFAYRIVNLRFPFRTVVDDLVYLGPVPSQMRVDFSILLVSVVAALLSQLLREMHLLLVDGVSLYI